MTPTIHLFILEPFHFFFEYLILLTVSLGIWGCGGVGSPEALTFNESKNQWNTSAPPPLTRHQPKYLMKYMIPPAPRAFYFQHPQDITKKKRIPTPIKTCGHIHVINRKMLIYYSINRALWVTSH